MRPETVPASRPTGNFRLGEWEVRPRHNELVSDAQTRHLEPKTMDLLVFLASAAPDVVSKDAIIDSIWQSRIISEGTLTNTIAELRRALGDDARHPRYIETIPKRGYCLIEAVEPVPAPTVVECASLTQRKRISLVVVGTVIATMIVATAIIWQTRQLPLDSEFVLVAPFVNRTGDTHFDATALLARDRVVSILSASGLVEAAPAHIDEPGDALDILCVAARESGAGLAVGGALYLQEGQIEVQAKLVDVRVCALLYAVPATVADRKGVSESLDIVVQRVAGAIATHRAEHAHFRLISHTPGFEAYQEFMTGSELFAIDRASAIHHLETALELDPKFTSAAFRLSVAYHVVGRHQDAASVLERVEERRSSLTEFERLWLDYFSERRAFNRREALALIRQIEEIVPDDLVVQHLICGNAAGLNRPRESIAAASSIIGSRNLVGFLRNPVAVGTYLSCATSQHILGNHTAELKTVRIGLRTFPSDKNLTIAEARALAAMGDEMGLEEAVSRALSTSTDLNPASLLIEAAATTRAHGRAGLARSLSTKCIEILDDRAAPEPSPFEALIRGQALVFLGDLDEAQQVFREFSSTDTGSDFEKLAVQGWVGVVAARSGDLETAHGADRSLAAYEGPLNHGWPTHFRAAIAAWLGHRNEAIDLIRRSQSEGWGSFNTFHDSHRVLFEPLEGMVEYERLLHPTG